MGKKIRETIFIHHKEGYDYAVLYGTKRNIQRTSLFYKKGKLRKTIDFIYPKQKTWIPVKIVTLFDENEEIHNKTGPAVSVICLEHRTILHERYYYKGKEIFKEGFDLLKNMTELKKHEFVKPITINTEINDSTVETEFMDDSGSKIDESN